MFYVILEGVICLAGPLCAWVLLHLPDPAFMWKTTLPKPRLVQDIEALDWAVEPTHDWKGLV